jgi:adenylate cyclase
MSNSPPAPSGERPNRENVSLSTATTGYIHKLLRRNLDRLKFTPDLTAEIASNPLTELETVLETLYPTADKANQVVRQLEDLVATHRKLGSHGLTHRLELEDLEQQVFRLLSFKRQDVDRQATILIVDDTPDNLRLLSAALRQQQYEIGSAISGSMALALAHNVLPDLILLDIRMPVIDGYEVCKQLKADPITQDIPIIFLSALDDVADKVKAFEVGGADYITKPFQIEEVLVRVENQLKLRNLQKRLEEQNERLQQEIHKREQLLREHKRMEERYRSIFEESVDGIFQISPEGCYLSANPALALIYGYNSPEELMTEVTDIGRQIYVQPQRRAELVAYMQRYDTVSDFESQVYCKNGNIIWVSEDVRAVKNADGEVIYYEGTVKDITERKIMEEELRLARRKTERLLLNILPQQIAERLKKGPTIIANNFSEATVLFADIVNFTPFSVEVSPSQLISMLNQIFSAFDKLVEQYELEKIKTIGDAYMAVGGIPKQRPDHPAAIAELALAMQRTIAEFKKDNGEAFRLRIGINTGPVVAGVIGTKKFSYDLWGDTVNIASRMESEGLAGKIQVTQATYERLKKRFLLESRGMVYIKGRGDMMTYWLTGKKPSVFG